VRSATRNEQGGVRRAARLRRRGDGRHMSTVVSQTSRAEPSDLPHVRRRGPPSPIISGDPELFAPIRSRWYCPTDAGPAPDGVRHVPVGRAATRSIWPTSFAHLGRPRREMEAVRRSLEAMTS